MSGANELWYRRPAECFNESLPIGNGRIGGCVYGGIKEAQISLNEDTLWSGYPRVSNQNCADVYRKAQKLTLAGKCSQAQDLLEQNFGDFLVQMYLPLGTLNFTMGHSDTAALYRRSLSLETAIHTVSYQTDGKTFTRECFVSEPAQVMAIRITCDQKASVSFAATLTGKLRSQTVSKDKMIYIDGNCPVCRAPFGEKYEGDASKFYSENDSEKGIGYRAAVQVLTKGGKISADERGFLVTEADEAYVYFAVRTSFNGAFRHPVTDGKPYQSECIRDLARAAEQGFDKLMAEHIKDYRRLYTRVALDLEESENSGLATDERLEKHGRGEKDNALYALLFHYGRYLTIAASRKGTQAMNLQGIWNEKLSPPWNCNYTLNINTEMNYWPTLACGLFECYQPLIALTRDLCEAGRKTAVQYYGANGFVSHHATDLWRVTHPNTNRLKGNTQWGQWCMSGGWLTMMLYEYYRYTQDVDYLRSIYPVISGCAEFYKSLLVWYDGEWILCPSTSPENNYRTSEGAMPLDKTTAMTMQIVRDVFDIVISSAKVLQYDSTEYELLIAHLKENHISADGTLAEWYTDHPDWEREHRHVSHLYALFPSHSMEGIAPKWLDACRKTLEKRGDGGTGWSLAWKINLWAKLADGEHACMLLDRQLQLVGGGEEGHDIGGGSYPNLLCAHPPFQIDGNFGACAGILNMLVQMDGQNVKLFPALPKSWKNGELRGVYLPGRKRLDMKWKDGKLVKHKIYDDEETE